MMFTPMCIMDIKVVRAKSWEAYMIWESMAENMTDA